MSSAGDEACCGASAPAETDSPRLASVTCSSSISLLCLSMVSHCHRCRQALGIRQGQTEANAGRRS